MVYFIINFIRVQRMRRRAQYSCFLRPVQVADKRFRFNPSQRSGKVLATHSVWPLPNFWFVTSGQQLLWIKIRASETESKTRNPTCRNFAWSHPPIRRSYNWREKQVTIHQSGTNKCKSLQIIVWSRAAY